MRPPRNHRKSLFEVSCRARTRRVSEKDEFLLLAVGFLDHVLDGQCNLFVVLLQTLTVVFVCIVVGRNDRSAAFA